MGILAGIGVLLPFPFYYFLWTHPHSWVNLCGKGRDPSKVIARLPFHEAASVHFSLFSFFSLLASSSLLLAPLCLWPVPQLQLLGESGTYYGVRFGKNIPWATEFPFGFIRDPQYVGGIMSLVACLAWVPFQYILLWSLGYVFMMHIESKENPATRAKPIS